MTTNKEKRDRNHKKIRTRIAGTSSRPRLSVFKSNTALYAQLIDDENGQTIAQASGKDPKKIGGEIAKLGLAKKISQVVFDRGGYIYTGKVEALANAAREGGLKF